MSILRRRIMCSGGSNKDVPALYIETSAAGSTVTFTKEDDTTIVKTLVSGVNKFIIPDDLGNTNTFKSCAFGATDANILSVNFGGIVLKTAESLFGDHNNNERFANLTRVEGLVIDGIGYDAFRKLQKVTYLQVGGIVSNYSNACVRMFSNVGYNATTKPVIDLSSLDTRRSTDAQMMFYYCKCSDIIVGENFVLQYVHAAFSGSVIPAVHVNSETPPQLSGDISINGQSINKSAVDWVGELISKNSNVKIYVPDKATYLNNTDWAKYANNLYNA